MIPPRVRRQQVVFVHLHARQLLPIVEMEVSRGIAGIGFCTGQLRVERTQICGEAGGGEEETNPLSDPPGELGFLENLSFEMMEPQECRLEKCLDEYLRCG